MKKTPFASKRNHNCCVSNLQLPYHPRKKGVSRFCSGFLILALLTQGFLVYPLRLAEASGHAPAPSLVSSPPEPFEFHSSSSDIGEPSIFAMTLLSRLTDLFSAPKSPRERSPSNPRHVPKKPVSETSASLTTEPLASNPNPNVLTAAYTTNKAASGIIFDYDEDGKADVGRWNGPNHEFKIKNSTNNSYSTTTGLGTSASKPVAGDLNGDGKTDAVVYNPGTTSTSGTWSYLISPLSASPTANPTPISIGVTGNSTSDIPVAGYFDSDAITDVGVFRPSTGYWYIKESSSSTTTSVNYGQSGDIPVMGDYDGDGKTDKAVFRPCTTGSCNWHILKSSTATDVTLAWGQSGDIPVQGDYDGDGKSDLAVYRPSDGIWYIAEITTNGPVQIASVGWGNYGDQPVPADYDNDGITDYAVWRPTTGVWYIIGSVPIPECESCGPQYLYKTLGSSGDKALPSVYTKQVGGTISGYDLAKERVAPRNATGSTDLYSQNFSWGTSLVNLPGRAGLDAGLSLSYNSLVWLKTDVGASEPLMSFDPDSSNVSPGFRFGFPVIEPVYYDSHKRVWNYLMVTPNGARKEFRQIAASNIYESGDSDYAQLVTTGASNPNDPVENITIKVTSTDGTQMSYSWIAGAFRCNKIQDRNGNYITISNDEYGLLRSVTDTLGRVINVNYDTELYPTSITQTWKSNNGASGNTTHTWATFTYTTQTVDTNFDTNNVAVVGPPDGTVFKVLEKVIYADTSYTKFLYNSYVQVRQIENYADNDSLLNYVRTDLDTFSGTSSAQSDCPRFTHTYNWAENFNMSSGSPPTAQETDTENTAPAASSFDGPNGEESTMVVNVKMAGHPDNLYTRLHFAVATEAEPWKTGLPVATEDCTDTGSTCSTRQRWTWTKWEQDQIGSTPFDYFVNPRVIETQVSDGENTKRTTVSYLPANSFECSGAGVMELEEGTNVACNGLVNAVAVYGSGSTPLKSSVTEYNLNSNYTSKRIIGLPSETRLYDENSALMSKVTYAYDNYSSPNPQLADLTNPTNQCRTTSSNCPTAYGTSFQYRGNLTSTTRWNVEYPTSSTYAVTSRVAYNIAGLPVSKTDPLNRTTSISYTDVWNDSVSRTTYAYPTTVTDPGNNSSTIKYRFDIGANVWAQSPIPYGGSTTNTIGKTTSREYSSTTGRIAKEKIENTGAYTKYDYGTDGMSLSTKSTIIYEGSGSPGTGDEVETVTLFDGAGRVLAVRSPHTYSGSSVSTWSATLTQYDMLGRVSAASVPTEVSVSGSTWTPTGDDYPRGFVFNRSYYDWKDRVVRTRPSDSDGTNEDKDTLISYDGCGCAGGQVTTIEGPVVPRDDTTGTARRKQKVTEDILGRQTKAEVFEWNGSTVHSTTTNTYNGRDQITSIKEYAGTTSGTMQETTMSYDGHGRLYQKHLPQWYGTSATTDKKYTTTTYNADDTVATVTDPRGAVTTYTYENVSGTPKRPLVTNISYATPSANPTPDNPLHVPSVEPVTFEYDAAGNRKTMSDGTGTLSYTYDELSRLKTETKDFLDNLPEAPSGGVYTLSYQYHLSGGLKSITDPFDRTTNYSVDKLGRMTAIGSGSTSPDLDAYMSNIQYRAFGAVKEMTMSTTYPTTISMTYDEVLRVTGYDANNTANGTSHVQQASYSYYKDGMVSAIDNQRDGTQFDQTNEYDFAGRLKKNYVGAAGGTFNQEMSYDTFSNLTSRTNYAYSSFLDSFSATFENNRQTSGQSTATYDNAGNVVHSSQPSVSGGRPYSDTKNWNFDAAGRLAHWDQNGPWENDTRHQFNTYDGDGRPVKKVELENVPWYYIYSSVTRQKITDVLVDGSDGGHRVYMGRKLIHNNTAHGEDISAIGFIVTDPISGSTQELVANGAIPAHVDAPYARNELAGLGTSIPIPPPGSSLLNFFPSINYSVGYGMGGFAGNAQSGCVDGDGNPKPCFVEPVRCTTKDGKPGSKGDDGVCYPDVEATTEPDRTIETFLNRVDTSIPETGPRGPCGPFYYKVPNREYFDKWRGPQYRPMEDMTLRVQATVSPLQPIYRTDDNNAPIGSPEDGFTITLQLLSDVTARPLLNFDYQKLYANSPFPLPKGDPMFTRTGEMYLNYIVGDTKDLKPGQVLTNRGALQVFLGGEDPVEIGADLTYSVDEQGQISSPTIDATESVKTVGCIF